MDDIKSVVAQKLNVPVSENDFEEILDVLSKDWASPITYEEFSKFEQEIA